MLNTEDVLDRSNSISVGRLKHSGIDDYATDGGEELLTKMLCVLIANP